MPITATGSGFKPGDIDFKPLASAPPGWLKANGAAISRTLYAALFNAIGTTFGAGDGATTFNLPDLRGEFLRGLDDGRGVDTGRALGSAQADAYKSHTHQQNRPAAQTGSNSDIAITASAQLVATASNQATAASGGTETRPRNVAFLACIKY